MNRRLRRRGKPGDSAAESDGVIVVVVDDDDDDEDDRGGGGALPPPAPALAGSVSTRTRARKRAEIGLPALRRRKTESGGSGVADRRRGGSSSPIGRRKTTAPAAVAVSRTPSRKVSRRRIASTAMAEGDVVAQSGNGGCGERTVAVPEIAPLNVDAEAGQNGTHEIDQREISDAGYGWKREACREMETEGNAKVDGLHQGYGSIEGDGETEEVGGECDWIRVLENGFCDGVKTPADCDVDRGVEAHYGDEIASNWNRFKGERAQVNVGDWAPQEAECTGEGRSRDHSKEPEEFGGKDVYVKYHANMLDWIPQEIRNVEELNGKECVDRSRTAEMDNGSRFVESEDEDYEFANVGLQEDDEGSGDEDSEWELEEAFREAEMALRMDPVRPKGGSFEWLEEVHQSNDMDHLEMETGEDGKANCDEVAKEVIQDEGAVVQLDLDGNVSMEVDADEDRAELDVGKDPCVAEIAPRCEHGSWNGEIGGNGNISEQVKSCAIAESCTEVKDQNNCNAIVISMSKEDADNSTPKELVLRRGDSDEEIVLLEDNKGSSKEKQIVRCWTPHFPSCVAWRTRSSWGTQDRTKYSTYFQVLSDDDKEVEVEDEDDDYTEAEDESEEDDNDYDDEEEDGKEEDEEETHNEHARAKDGKVKRRINELKIIKTMHRQSSDSQEEEEFDCDEFVRPLYYGKVDAEDPDSRKRSRFTWELERQKKLELGILKKRRKWVKREPEFDSEFSSESDSEGGKGLTKSGMGSKGAQSSKAAKRRHRKEMLKRQSLVKLLMDSAAGDNGQQPVWHIEQKIRDHLPLVFSFGDDNPVSEEPTEHETYLNGLWEDMEFAVESENIGTYTGDEVQVDQIDFPGTSGVINLCSNGKHRFILDEQVGIVCQCCSFVELEIKYFLSSLAKNYSEKFEWRNSSNVKNALMYDDLYKGAEDSDQHIYNDYMYGTVWDLIPGVITTMYEHQQEAFEFMWNNLAGSISLHELRGEPRTDVVGGCVICHAPGTGKTRLAILFIQTYLMVYPECRPVVIAPRGMLYSWQDEFKKWGIKIPFHIMNSTDCSGKEDRDLFKLIKKENRTDKLTRLVKLLSWNRGHGVLGISYGLYKTLTSDKADSPEGKQVRSILLDRPGLLVLDEGHTPRNDRSVIWKTLGKVKSEKRIILSGTPFQNNFLELYNILCLVRPKFADTFLAKIVKRPKTQYSRGYKYRRSKPKHEAKGIWASLTSNVTDDNAEKIRAILKPYVHIHSGNILRTLPGLRECVIVLKPPPLQQSIIQNVENIGSGNNFEHEYNISLASIHPSLVTAINMTAEEASFIDKPLLEKLRLDPMEGVKTRFVVEVVRLCEALKEKVLIFSQFIQPLALIKDHLTKVFKWREGKEILQMDGTIQPRNRQSSIDMFNNTDSEAKVLLASTRACCEGISLTGASRVVLLDVVWNPAVGRQAISRAYRIGQQRFVYTYNLITYGTGEKDKYNRQSEKDHLSKLVFSTDDDFYSVRSALAISEREQSSKFISEDKILSEMTSHDQLEGMFLKLYYPPTESNMLSSYNQTAPGSS